MSTLTPLNSAKPCNGRPGGGDRCRNSCDRSQNLSARTQEVENILLLVFPQIVEIGNHEVRFRRVVGAGAAACVLLYRNQQIRCAAVMQEEDALSYTPQR
jgi:hypothetical protein